MDIQGVLFHNKGPRDHKAFCEQVFKPDKKSGGVNEWVVDVGWQDKYIWEKDPDKLDFDTRVSGHTFESHSQSRTDGCGLTIWTAVNENFDFQR